MSSFADVIEDKINEAINEGVKECFENTSVEELLSELASSFSVSDIAGEIDLDKLAKSISTDDIATCIDCETLAGEFTVSDIAEHVDLASLADYLDFDKLAAAFSKIHSKMEGEIESLHYQNQEIIKRLNQLEKHEGELTRQINSLRLQCEQKSRGWVGWFFGE